MVGDTVLGNDHLLSRTRVLWVPVVLIDCPIFTTLS